MDSRDMALTELRNRSKNLAHCQVFTEINLGPLLVRVYIDDDGDMNLTVFKEWISSQVHQGTDLDDGESSISSQSYRKVADNLYDRIASRFTDRSIKIEVTGYGESGISVCYKKTTRSNTVIKY